MATITNEDGWVTISKDSGSGDDSVTATINSANTGREARSTTLKGTTAHEDEAESVITQGGLAEYVSFTDATKSVANNATSVIVHGKSNSKRLTFSLSASVDYLVLPSTFEVNKGVTANNGQDIEGDPGASEEYDFAIMLTTKDTTPSNARTQTLTVAAYGGGTASCAITQDGIASEILFDGYSSGKVYDVTNIPAGGTKTINIGLSPNGENWTLAFDEE